MHGFFVQYRDSKRFDVYLCLCVYFGGFVCNVSFRTFTKTRTHTHTILYKCHVQRIFAAAAAVDRLPATPNPQTIRHPGGGDGDIEMEMECAEGREGDGASRRGKGGFLYKAMSASWTRCCWLGIESLTT